MNKQNERSTTINTRAYTLLLMVIFLMGFFYGMDLAHAEAHYDGKFNQVVVMGEHGTVLGTMVSPTRDCVPQVYLYEEGYTGSEKADTMRFTARIDRRVIWTVTANRLADPGDGSVFATWDSKPEFINELRRGTTLRIKVPQADGSNYYEGFGLMGYSAALAKAKAACKPNASYFNDTPRNGGHETYL